MVKSFRKGTAAWLSSQGHPGYGPEYAADIWRRVVGLMVEDGVVGSGALSAETSRAFDALTVQVQSGYVWSAVKRERMGWVS